MSIELESALPPPEASEPRPEHHPAARSDAMTLLHAAPAIVFITLMMWSGVGVVGFLLGAFINAEAIGFIIAAVVLGPAAIWANRRIVMLALAAERYPDS